MEIQPPGYENLPSGKVIIRHIDDDGFLKNEAHSYGLIEIGITYEFNKGTKTDETYIIKNRLVSRKSYEKARIRYPDMPPADDAILDLGSELLRAIRTQQKQKKAEKEKRLADSPESHFPRPSATNWLRVIASDQAHLVVFTSRDWKVLVREATIRSGREWMQVFGFFGLAGTNSSIAKGPETGFEVPGDRNKMIEASRVLLKEVLNYTNNPPEKTIWQGSIRPRRKRNRREPELAWTKVLPPLIEFLSKLEEPNLKIFNHHQ